MGDVVLGEGRLTLSAIRSSRFTASVALTSRHMRRFGSHVARQPGSLSVSLSDNFRSVSGLVDWYNERSLSPRDFE